MYFLQAPRAPATASSRSRNAHGAPKRSLLIYIQKPLKPQCITWLGSSQLCTSVACGPASSEPARREHFKLWQELSTNKLKGGFEKSPKRQVFKLKHLHYFHLSDCSPWNLICRGTGGWVLCWYNNVPPPQWFPCLSRRQDQIMTMNFFLFVFLPLKGNNFLSVDKKNALNIN